MLSGAAQSDEYGAEMYDTLTIPYEKSTLENGLTIIVSEDHRVPLVNVRVWYRVGAQQGPYAHLFEHVFWRSEPMERDFRDVLSELGAVIVDANTQSDRTNYFETVPKTVLDAVLWLESSRMGYPLLTQEMLDKERKIVRNEIRLRESQATYRILQATLAGAYPPQHPYSKVVGATEEQLQEATLAAMRAWHHAYYGAANATLVITGDVTADEVRRKVEKYFAEVRPGPPVGRTKTWIAKHTETRRGHMTADVAAPQLRMAWNVPPWGSAEVDYLKLMARLLAGDNTACLHRRLVEEESLVTDVEAGVMTMEISSLFTVAVTARAGADLHRIEAIVQEEVARFTTEVPAPGALRRAKAQHRLAFAEEIEHLGRWTGGKSNILARGEAYRGDPGHYRIMLYRTDGATAADLERTAREWLLDGAFVLEVRPPPSHAASAIRVDRSRMPPVGSLPNVPFTRLTHASLENGMDVILAPCVGGGLVTVTLLVHGAGYAADPQGTAGRARLLLSVLEKGEVAEGSISDRLAALGAKIESDGTMDVAWLNLTTLGSELGPALRLFTQAVRRPVFSEVTVEEVRTRLRMRVGEEAREYAAKRFLPPLLYGDAHPYGRPFTGTGSVTSLDAVTPADLRKSYHQHYQPDVATLIVAGNFSRQEVMSVLQETLGTWQAGRATEPNMDLPMPEPGTPTLYLIDQPGANLSRVYAAQLVPEWAKSNRATFLMMRFVLGAFDLQGRLMRNLREDKGWTYRASLLSWPSMLGSEPMVAYAPVQANKTASAIREIIDEWHALGHERPVTAEELRKAKQTIKLKMVSHLETLEVTTSLIRTMVALGLPEDYYDTLAVALDRLRPASVTEMARQVLRPHELVWLVVGDLDEIEDDMRALGLGEMHVLEPEVRTGNDSE